MSDKIKHRQQRRPRHQEINEIMMGRKGGPMKDKRDKRCKRENEWKEEIRNTVR